MGFTSSKSANVCMSVHPSLCVQVEILDFYEVVEGSKSFLKIPRVSSSFLKVYRFFFGSDRSKKILFNLF